MLPNLGRLTLAGDVATGVDFTVRDHATADELVAAIETLRERLRNMNNSDPRVRPTRERQMSDLEDECRKIARTVYENTVANYPKMSQPRDREDVPNFKDAATTRPDQFVRSSRLDYINGDSPQSWWGYHPREDDGLDRPSGLQIRAEDPEDDGLDRPSGLQIRDEGREDDGLDRGWHYKSLTGDGPPAFNSLPAGPDDGPPDSPIEYRDC